MAIALRMTVVEAIEFSWEAVSRADSLVEGETKKLRDDMMLNLICGVQQNLDARISVPSAQTMDCLKRLPEKWRRQCA